MIEHITGVRYVRNLDADPDHNRILARLGYKKGITGLDDYQAGLFNDCLKEVASICRPAGAYTMLGIMNASAAPEPLEALREDGAIRLENGLELSSSGLAKLLAGSSRVLFMAATAGHEVTDRINEELGSGDPAKALIMDSVASQTADALLDRMMSLIGGLLAPDGMKLTRKRYSPGYGDLSLEWQKIIFDLLALEKIGMKITDKFMLVPEKSVIAVAGVEIGM